MRPAIILRYSGIILLFDAAFLAISSIISAFYSDSALLPLLYSAVIAAMFGVFPLIFVPPAKDISNKEGFFVVICSWLLSCLAGAMPYVLWGGEFTLTNAWFESVSGFTTTGSSIVRNIEALPLGLLFWRSATHWIGGVGIIIFALSVLPSMGRAGMVLYRTETSSLATENFRYRTREALKILVMVYAGLTIAETIGLLVCGLNWFDAVTHSFATIATGGFSPRNASVAYYQSVSVEMVILVFMVLSGLHFGLLFSAIRKNPAGLWRSSIVRYYLLALAIGVILATFTVYGHPFSSWNEALRFAGFQIVSLGTSTGFATTDTALWPSLAKLLMIYFTLQCACAGSTSGGIKVDRVVIFWKGLLKAIHKMRHPQAVIAPKIDGVVVDADALEAGVLYVVLYLGVVFFSSVILTAFGVDILTAFSGSAATMGNVGPGFGIVSSMSNYSQIPNIGKWVLTATMLLGRLEIFGLILFVTARSWR
jgi:trk system potassium uptake protein TrkH